MIFQAALNFLRRKKDEVKRSFFVVVFGCENEQERTKTHTKKHWKKNEESFYGSSASCSKDFCVPSVKIETSRKRRENSLKISSRFRVSKIEQTSSYSFTSKFYTFFEE